MRIRVAIVLLPGLISMSCASSPTYVAADRATHDAIAPEYAQYVASDTDLTDAERARRLRTLETWRIRLETAERSNAR